MVITIVATLMVMAAYFLVLYGGVGFIQDKRFFSSAHKDILAVIPDKKERFRGAHIIGWVIAIIAVLLFAGTAVLSIWDGIRNGFTFLKFFARFLVILYCMEIYDILFFDWVLLCHSNFFPHFYPEVKGVAGPHMFGYNKKAHLLHFVIYIPVCALIAWVCTLF
ncbi:MAG: hypothetical protein UGE21_05625 [Lachnospiraceae bacterium]|nr:hypothetical protein [Lachnospiraceae bacterium]